MKLSDNDRELLISEMFTISLINKYLASNIHDRPALKEEP